jgi:helix-turn-helix protein
VPGGLFCVDIEGDEAMALDPIVWALKDAPVADAIERLVLAIYAEHADEDGCSAFPSYKTVAKRAMTDRRTVIRRVQDLVARGLLAEGNPAAAAAIPHRYRPKVYDVMIPHSWWGPSAVERINAYRAQRGRRPITPETRPEIDAAPARTPRADAGRRRGPGQECLPDTPGGETEGCLPDPTRGDSQTPAGVGDRHPTLPYNPPHEPPPPTPATEPAGVVVPEPHQVVVETNPNPAAAAADVSEVAALVDVLPWPAGRRPDRVTRRRLAEAIRACRRRGHPLGEIRDVAAAGIPGATTPAGSVLARLRELAAREPDAAELEASRGASERRRRDHLAATPHGFEPGSHGQCSRCGRPGSASVHPPTYAPSTRRCQHGRLLEVCPDCRSWTIADRPAAIRPHPSRGLDALEEALAQMRTAGHLHALS